MIQSGVSEDDVQDIIDGFNLTRLDAVYTRLGLEEKDIVEARLTHLGFPKQQAKMLLNRWRNRCAEEATRGNMIAAMKMCSDCRRDMNDLIRKWNTGDATELGKGNDQ